MGDVSLPKEGPTPIPAPSRGGVPDTDAQKSLEAELEKVASVIDLRNKPKE